MKRVTEQGFGHEQAKSVPQGRPYLLERSAYADMFGPTAGDKVVYLDFFQMAPITMNNVGG
jgi:urease